MKLKGTYYGGYSSTPHQAEIDIVPGGLEIRNEGNFSEGIFWPSDKVKFRNYQNKFFHFSYENGEKLESFEVEFTDKSIYKLANKHYKPFIDEISYKLLYYRLKIVIPLAFGVIGLLAGIYLYVLPEFAGQLASQLPQGIEEKIGDHLHNSISEDIVIDYEKSIELNDFYKALHHKTSYNYKFYVVADSNVVNAFAAPGGHIYVFQGILRKIKTPEQLSSLMFHEMGHIENKHTIKYLFRAISRSVFLNLVTSDINGIAGFLAENLNVFYTLKYSKELEEEADLYAISQMTTSQLNIDGMVDLFKVLKEEEIDITIPEFLSTHPLTDNRILKAEKARKAQSQIKENLELKSLLDKLLH